MLEAVRNREPWVTNVNIFEEWHVYKSGHSFESSFTDDEFLQLRKRHEAFQKFGTTKEAYPEEAKCYLPEQLTLAYQMEQNRRNALAQRGGALRPLAERLEIVRKAFWGGP